VRGRIGVRYLTLRNARGASAELSQPALDVRLDGANIGGVPVDVTVDARGRRTSQSLDVSTETHESLRIYRLSATVHDVSGRRRATLGRQTAAALSTLSLFDGLLVETAGERWSVGLLTGTQPLGRDLGVSGDILQHGGYVALRQRAGAPRRWSVSLGAVSSWRGSTSNRDVVVAQGTYADRRWSLFVTQEADVNRGWRRASGEQAVSPTSTYALARAQATPDIALTLGYDNRRSVRLYRDRETPETEFDDSHRQGVWGGASFDVSDRVRLAVDARARDGSAGGSTRTWSAATDVRPPVRAVDRLRCRVAESWGAATRTRLASVGAGVSPIWALRIDLEAGVRETEDDLAADPRETAGWERVALDFNVAGRWYLNTSLERDHGEQEDIRQVDVGLTWRL
jgi:hypothetical protein